MTDSQPYDRTDIEEIAARNEIARRSTSARLCRKCSARSRWHRRKAWRSSKTTPRYRTGKK